MMFSTSKYGQVEQLEQQVWYVFQVFYQWPQPPSFIPSTTVFQKVGIEIFTNIKKKNLAFYAHVTYLITKDLFFFYIIITARAHKWFFMQ